MSSTPSEETGNLRSPAGGPPAQQVGDRPDPALVWSPEYLTYKLSANHPMNPVRLDLTMALSAELGLLDGVETITPAPATDAELLRVHTREYIDAVKLAPRGGPVERLLAGNHGLGTEDTPIFEHMHEAAAIMTGGTVAAARAIATGRARRAVNIGGGLHHAMPDHGSGFCVYNDAAVAIEWLLDHGFDRIAYIDVDVHHGDGVQRAFIGDPRVMTVSIHQHPATLWPSTGWPAEVGMGDAEGTAVNIAVLPGTGDALWLRAFHAVVPSVVRAFKPQIIVSQCGVDSHREDPLADLSLTVDGQRAAFLAMRALADECADGRWLAVGGGGYGLVRVVPRSWTHLIAAVLGREIDPATAVPESWRRRAATLAPGVEPPVAMGDGGDAKFSRWEGGPPRAPVVTVPGVDRSERDLARLDSAIADTRRNVFPLLGLDPDDPRD